MAALPIELAEESDWFFLYSLVSLYPRHRALAYFRLWGTRGALAWLLPGGNI